MVWLVALLVGCSVLTSCSEQKKRTRKAAVKVETLTVGDSNASGKTKDYVGTIEEKTGSTLSFELGGNITSIRVDEGDRVSKGQVLATINPTTLNETHRGALSTLKQAQDAYRRFQPLHKAGTISDIKWVEIESKLEQAKAAEAIARQQLTHTSIRAPFNGVVASKQADMGTYVLPGQPVLKIADVKAVNAKLSVPEAEISHLHIGDKVRVSVGALGDAVFWGTISEKGIDANPISHTYDVKVGIENTGRRLLPGMVCNAQVTSGDTQPAQIAIPAKCIELDTDNTRFVWTVVKGKAHQQHVEVGGFCNNDIIVLSGLGAGDEVIVGGQQKVSEGMRVCAGKNVER